MQPLFLHLQFFSIGIMQRGGFCYERSILCIDLHVAGILLFTLLIATFLMACAGSSEPTETTSPDGESSVPEKTSAPEVSVDSEDVQISEIVPEDPYTDEDLNYNDNNSRSTIEMNDPSSRPAISGQVENMEQYDIVFIGFPTWWYDMPQVLYSFFDEYDFSGKTIIPFNVHNGSRFSGTIETIQELEPDATVITDGFTVNEKGVADAAGDVADWLEEIGY